MQILPLRQFASKLIDISLDELVLFLASVSISPDAATVCKVERTQMLSGAFHDALFLNRVAPPGMIFVPCRDGLSHNEAEHVEPSAIIAGCEVFGPATLSLLEGRLSLSDRLD